MTDPVPSAHRQPVTQAPASFDEAASVAEQADGSFRCQISPPWSQGRTVFGGVLAAMMAGAMASKVNPDLRLRTLQAIFLAPLAAGLASVCASSDRVGSNTAFTSAQVTQDGRLSARCNAVFARDRASAIEVRPAPPIIPLGFDDAPALPFIEGLTPEFTRNFDFRWAVGGFPMTGSAEAELGGYCRHTTTATGVGAVLGLLDAWPPPVLPIATGPTFASTIALTAHILRDVPDLTGRWCTFRYRTVSAANGYATYLGTLAVDESVVAWTEQVAAVFDSPNPAGKPTT